MEKNKIILGVSILLIVSGQVNAAIIDMGNYQYDESTGLEWLDLSITSGISVSSAISQYSNDGWSLATEDQFHVMYSNYDNTGNDRSVFGYTKDYDNNSIRGLEYATAGGVLKDSDMFYTGNFFEDFGITSTIKYDYDSDGHMDASYYSSYGLYDSGQDHYTFMGGIWTAIFDDGQAFSSDLIRNYYDYDNFYSKTTSINGYGVFLIRETTVPEPSILALMFTGLIGLGVARRNS